jgi:tetratricopeptide (TPR) repeat protein
VQEPHAKLSVFISSTSGALLPYRLAAVEVCHRLGLTPVYMEEFDPQRPTPEEVCRRALEGSDIYILLLAHRYGARPPGQEFSYTELEYQWATSRADMPMLAFVVDPTFAWPPPDIDRGTDADALARFTTHVLSDHVKRPLAELAKFREDLMLALSHVQHEWAARETREDESAKVDSPKKKQSSARRREFRIPAAPAFHAVPPYVGGAPFTGRAADLTTLDDWARSPYPVMVIEAIGGTGKSALAWQWAQDRAPAVIDGLAGRLWWSFYEGSASMTRFLQELLAYTTARSMKEIRELDRADLAEQALTALRQRPYLVVLDGFERLLAAYHRFDPSKLRDDEVEPDKRSLIEPQAEEIVRRLAAAGPSKILVSTRLMPTALQGRFGHQLPGVRHLRLPGLTDADTRALLVDLDVRGSDPAVTGFFHPLGNHPLLIGIVAGLVRDYRAEPGGFDRWLADPTAGGALRLPDLDLTQRRAHILAAAFDGLEPGSRRLLGWISVLAGAVSWSTLEAVNPFRPEPPAAIRPGFSSIGRPAHPRDPAAFRKWRDATAAAERADRETEELLAERRSSEPVMRATAQLGTALKDLEDRGLLWWDRSSNTYDLHPIIRAHAHEQLEDIDRVRANDRVRDHFQALPPEDIPSAASVEDLNQTITIFRALIGAGHIYEASEVWDRLNPVLLVRFGAYATITELLAPIADDQAMLTAGIRADLAIAHWSLGRLDEAIELETGLLSYKLRKLSEDRTDADITEVRIHLSNLGHYSRASGAPVAGARYFELRAAANAAAKIEQDASFLLSSAEHAAARGDIEQARDLLSQARTLDPPSISIFWDDAIELLTLYLALVVDRSLTHMQIDDALSRARSWQQRRDLAELRCELFIQEGLYAPAFTAALEGEQLSRNAGLDVAPACSAFLLAKLGRADEATAAAEEALARLDRIHPAQRPYYYLALALWELRRAEEAQTYARHAYQQAWVDGPPHCHYWDLRAARELLDSMGEPYPDLPVTDPATVRVPLEDEIRAFIAALEEAKRAEDGG